MYSRSRETSLLQILRFAQRINALLLQLANLWDFEFLSRSMSNTRQTLRSR
jgi:hypothetical protein